MGMEEGGVRTTMELGNRNVFILLGVFGALGAYVNHIDDTDETYGYWEPLHFILHGEGMQTWEYSPDFAIRTYAFVLPFVPFACVARAFNMTKIDFFFFCKVLLGLLFAFSTNKYVDALHSTVGKKIANYMLIFLLTSPGMFFCSTALLPSAVCASLLMLSFAAWLRNSHIWAIFYGCVAVIWSGWPFVAVLFIPIGAHMVYAAWSGSPNCQAVTIGSRFQSVIVLLLSGLTVLTVIAGSALAIDTFMYGKLTFPPLNIALYNAFGGRGDELYGIEPASYYIRNLLLMVGLVTFPLAMYAPLGLLIATVFPKTHSPKRETEKKKIVKTNVHSNHDRDWTLLTLFAPAVLWLGIMFTRPHKEERFMYPIYPLLASMAAYSLDGLSDAVVYIATAISPDTPSAAPAPGSVRSIGVDDATRYFRGRAKLLRWIVIGGTFAACALAGVSRMAASHRNYGGYFRLWIKTNGMLRKTKSPSNVCMGGDWYTFPSHFFLPPNGNLSFVEDNFQGLLPQRYDILVGTAGRPPLPVNDLNTEERSRYVDLESTCDYLVMTTPSTALDKNKYTPLQKKVLLTSHTTLGTPNDDKPNRFTRVHCEEILDAAHSPSVVFRAFYVPFAPRDKNAFMEYCLYTRQSYSN